MIIINFAYKSGTNGYWNLNGIDKVIKSIKNKNYSYPIPQSNSIIKLHINNSIKKYLVTEVNYIYGNDNDQDNYENVYIYVYLIYIDN